MIIFVLGGARSGKSAWAEQLAHAHRSEAQALYVATAVACDAEMTQRIVQHQERREQTDTVWTTIDAPLLDVTTVHDAANDASVVVIECMGTWLTNWLLSEQSVTHCTEEQAITAHLQRLFVLFRSWTHKTIIMVSNEVGMGIVPSTPLARSFRDHCGRMNQWLVAQSDLVYQVTAGIPIVLPKLSSTPPSLPEHRAPSSSMLSLSSWYDACIVAFRWMTTFPTPKSTVIESAPIAHRSLLFYPVTGLMIGGCLGAVAFGLSTFVPSTIQALILLWVWIRCTGGLHLDGWIDTADALGSHRSPIQKRMIMKDPHVGAQGVLAAVLLLLAKFVLLEQLLRLPASIVYSGLLLAPLLSRAILPGVIVITTYVGSRSNITALLPKTPRRFGLSAVCLGAVLVLGVLGWMMPPKVMWLGCGTVFMTMLVTSHWIWRCRNSIGGMTGDTYGALVERVEVAMLCTWVGVALSFDLGYNLSVSSSLLFS